MIRRPPRSTLDRSSAASDVYKRQDLVLGIYYLTKSRSNTKGEGRIFSDFDEVVIAYEQGDVTTHTPIRVRYSGRYIDLTTQYNDQDIVHAEVQDVERTLIDTTVGRVLFNRALPEVVPFINCLLYTSDA